MKSFIVLLAALILLLGFVVADPSAPLIVRPLSVSRLEVPDYLKSSHPGQLMIIVRLIPTNHPAAPDGNDLEPGEASWLDRGMKPMEPENIRFFIPTGDSDSLVNLLKTSDTAFRFTVSDTTWGYFDTVPLVSPKIVSIGAPKEKVKNPDELLNQTYQKLLADHAKDEWYTNALRRTQQAWLKYRDDRADLEAWVIGRDHPDEGARAKELRILNAARLANLKKSPINGLAWKFTWATPREPGNDHFDVYGDRVHALNIPGLTSAWDKTNDEWPYFEDAERLFESHGNLNVDGKYFEPSEPEDTALGDKVDQWLDQEQFGDITLLAVKLGLKQ